MTLDALDSSQGVGLYTDGSAWTADRSGGFAWIAIDAFDGEWEGCGHAEDTTNNRMEIMAWVDGLNAIHQAHGPCYVIVFSDSQYVGFGAMDRDRQRRANVDLWDQLDGAIDLHLYVEFMHVKGHGSDQYNKRVDKLASMARRKKWRKI